MELGFNIRFRDSFKKRTEIHIKMIGSTNRFEGKPIIKLETGTIYMYYTLVRRIEPVNVNMYLRPKQK